MEQEGDMITNHQQYKLSMKVGDMINGDILKKVEEGGNALGHNNKKRSGLNGMTFL